MKKYEELKDLGVRGRFYDLAWSKPVLRAPAVHGVSSIEEKIGKGKANPVFTFVRSRPHGFGAFCNGNHQQCV